MRAWIFYFAAGALVLAGGILWRRFGPRDRPDLVDLMTARTALQGGAHSGWFAERLIAPGLAVAIVVLAWPVVLALRVKHALEHRYAELVPQPEVFTVRPDELLEHLTIAQIEAREMVTDPLNAVPNLPFGHLNAIWEPFRDALESAEVVWSFSSRRQKAPGFWELRSGYVVVREASPRAILLTEARSEQDAKPV